MIRFKQISKVYPNGLTWAHYFDDDILNEPWYKDILELITLIQEDSPKGWRLVFRNFLSSTKSSVFYPVMTSFSDWEADYSIGSDIIKFNSQQDYIADYFTGGIGPEAGERIYPTKTGKGNRWLFGDQMNRIKGYSKETILELLYNISLLGRTIPVSGWETNIFYGEKIKAFCNDYKDYLLNAYLLPPSWYIIDRVGEKNWLKVLDKAGILDNGVFRTSRGVRCIAKDGHECNSLAELEIDNWLFSNQIVHDKEPHYPYHSVYNPNERLRADFKIGNVYVEYAGLLDQPEYCAKMQNKKELAKALKIDLVIVKPNDINKLTHRLILGKS